LIRFAFGELGRLGVAGHLGALHVAELHGALLGADQYDAFADRLAQAGF